MKIQVLRKDDFPSHKFFSHLLKGTEYYQNRIFDRAVEEWVAASKSNFATPIYLKDIEGKKFFGSMLEEIPILFFLYAIYINKITGIGMIKSEGVSKKLFFQRGLLVFVATTSDQERIGNFVLKKENLTPEKLKELINESRNQDKKLGVYLVEKRLLSQKTLQGLLTLQVEEVLSDSLFWQKGHIYFAEKSITEEPVVKYAPTKIALLSAQREFDFSQFRKEISSNKVIFRQSPYLEEERVKFTKKLDINDQFIFSLINGARNIDQLMKFSGANEVSVINTIYRLNAMGLIRRTKEVGEYEDKEFDEIVQIVKVLFEIFKLITTELYYELGLQARKIIQKARNDLTPDNQMVFIDVPLEEPDKLSTDAILRNTASFFPSTEHRFVSVEAFHELYINIMNEAKSFLGLKLTDKMIKTIDRIKTDIETFSVGTNLRKRLLTILDELIQKYG